MQNDIREVRGIRDRLIELRERQRVLEIAYRRNQLPTTQEALLRAQELTEQLTTKFRDATASVASQNTSAAIWA